MRRRLFGRSGELSRLGELFAAGAPIVSIIGPGGIGKTSLARMYAERCERPVWWIDLEALASADQIPGVVLGARSHAQEESSETQVARAMAETGDLLVVFDNLEQLLPEGAQQLARWIDAAPEASFLVTSRDVLRLSAETSLELGPFSTEEDAVELFLEKVRPGWAPSERDRESIAEIVARVDRIPLAIELAAARARSVPLDQLAQHLKDDLSLLDRGFVDAPERHRTLGSAIAWSVSRLDDGERDALYAASCFHQPFDADAIGWVLDRPALHLTQVLRDRSLLYVPEPGKLAMYSAIQHFVRREPKPELDGRFEELVVREARAGRIRREELAAVVAKSSAIERVLEAALHLSLRDLIPGRDSTLERSLMRAIECAGPIDRQLLARVRIAMADLRWFRGELGQAELLATAALGIDAELDARARIVLARVHFGRGAMKEALADLEVGMADQLADRRPHAEALQVYGAVRQSLGLRREAERDLLEARDIARSLGAIDLEAHAEASLGTLALDEGRLEASRARYARARELAMRSRQTRTIDVVSAYSALTELEAGNAPLAEELAEQALEGATRSGNRLHQAVLRSFLAAVVATRDKVELAQSLVNDAEAALYGVHAWSDVARVHSGHLHLARARAAEKLGDRVERERELSRAEVCLEAAATPARDYDDVRIGARILERALIRERQRSERPAATEQPRSLLLGPSAKWFSVDGGLRTDLSRRPLLRALLGALAEQESLALEALILRAWPGERINPEVHRNRLHVALSTLRSLGLRDVIERDEHGYRIARSIEVHFIET